jgi:hypothetical protein
MTASKTAVVVREEDATCSHILKTGEPCARKAGHKTNHRNAAYLERQRSKDAARYRSDSYRATDAARRSLPERRVYLTEYLKGRDQKPKKREARKFWQAVIDAVKVTRGCESCGFKSERPGYFDLDHVDRSTKTIAISVLIGNLTPDNPEHATRLGVELAKCQVLCVACHRDKSAKELLGE